MSTIVENCREVVRRLDGWPIESRQPGHRVVERCAELRVVVDEVPQGHAESCLSARSPGRHRAGQLGPSPLVVRVAEHHDDGQHRVARPGAQPVRERSQLEASVGALAKHSEGRACPKQPMGSVRIRPHSSCDVVRGQRTVSQHVGDSQPRGRVDHMRAHETRGELEQADLRWHHPSSHVLQRGPDGGGGVDEAWQEVVWSLNCPMIVSNTDHDDQ